MATKAPIHILFALQMDTYTKRLNVTFGPDQTEGTITDLKAGYIYTFEVSLYALSFATYICFCNRFIFIIAIEMIIIHEIMIVVVLFEVATAAVLALKETTRNCSSSSCKLKLVSFYKYTPFYHHHHHHHNHLHCHFHCHYHYHHHHHNGFVDFSLLYIICFENLQSHHHPVYFFLKTYIWK